MATEILTCYLIQGKTLLNVFEVLGAAGVILFHHTAWSVSKADGKGRKRLGCQEKKHMPVMVQNIAVECCRRTGKKNDIFLIMSSFC